MAVNDQRTIAPAERDVAREVIGEFQTVVLGRGGMLILTHLYGTWRLAHLAGPSVAEFRADVPSPWIGQPRGF